MSDSPAPRAGVAPPAGDAIARLAAVSLDCADPAELAAFYAGVLGARVTWRSDDFIALTGAAVLVTLQRVENYRAPDWPTGAVPKQLHLELGVDDLDDAEQSVVRLGARKAEVQPSPDRWRVLLDPAGHPFCLTTLSRPVDPGA